MNFKVKSPEVFKAVVQYSIFIAQRSVIIYTLHMQICTHLLRSTLNMILVPTV